MSRVLLMSLVALVLGGCGGGGSVDSPPPIPSFAPSLPAEFPIVYDGESDAAPIDFATAGPFFRYVLTDSAADAISTDSVASRAFTKTRPTTTRNNATLLRDAFGRARSVATEHASRRAVAVSDVAVCAFGGTITTTGTVDDSGRSGTLTVRYSDCIEDSEKQTGVVEIRFRPSDSGDPSEVQTELSVAQMVINSAKGQVSMEGTATALDRTSCFSKITESSLLRDDATGKVIKTENAVTEDIFCGVPRGNPQRKIAGRIFHTDFGYVDVTTARTITLERTNIADVFPILDGEFALVGADGAAVNVVVSGGAEPSLANLATYAEVRRQASVDAPVDQILRLAVPAVWKGALFDLGDNDNDGMLNQWELLYGLNPNEPSDADSDLDGDGRSNRIEAQYRSDPSDSRDVPIVVDVRTELPGRLLREKMLNGDLVWLTPLISQTSNTLDAYNKAVTMVVTKTSNVEWRETPGCVVDSVDKNRLTCKSRQGFEVVLPNSAGEKFSVTFAAAGDYLDDDLSNNSATWSGTTALRHTDVTITVGDGIVPVAIGSSGALYFYVRVWTSTAAVGVVAQLEVPPGLRFESLVSERRSPTLVFPCTGEALVTCDLGTSYSWMSGLELRANFKAVSEGLKTVKVDLTSIGIDDVPGNNSFVGALRVGMNLASTQAEIDAASPGATVVVPEGVFVGDLDFRGKSITLSGAPGQSMFYSRVMMGRDSVIENVSFGGHATIFADDGARIEGSTFEGWATVTSPTEISPTNGIAVSRPIVGLVIKRNRFNGDSRVAVAVESFIAQNNIFDRGDRALAIKYYPGSAATSARVVIANNMFVNVLSPIGISGPSSVTVLAPADFDIQNNLFVGADTRVGVQSGSADPIIVKRSLVFPASSVDSLFGSVIGQGERVGDPMFVDAANGDFRLQAGSPAIDAGIAAGAPANDYAGQTRPIDGNGDGVAAPDIGAYEFVP